jgi:hypothetical protein
VANERWDYVTLRPINDPEYGRMAYDEGAGIMAQVVADWGLTVGEDVKPARPDVVARPAGNAARSQWAAYRLGQGADPEQVDGMTRDELRDMDTVAEDTSVTESEGVEPAKGE